VANASDFEKLLRAEFANFAKAQGLEFADSSVEQRQLQSREHLVWLTAYEKQVSLLVDWGGDTLHSNMVAVNGDGSAERPRQIYEALVRHLRATNIPFTVEPGTVIVAGRSTRSSGNTMDLPRDIKEQVLNYIDLEFGESRGAPGALKSSDLVYGGAFESAGTIRHYWHFPAGGRQLWVTVTPVRDTFEISGFLTDGPAGSKVKGAE
jgi:hypothetical protein